MSQTTSLQPLPMMRTAVTHVTQAPPYSPTLINLNQKFNMSANSLTEALLLLSGMYISLVQPDPGPVKIALHSVFPRTTGPFVNGVTHPFMETNRRRTYMKYPAIPTAFNISSNLTRSYYSPKDVLTMLCENIFPKNTVTIFYLNNHFSLGEYDRPTVSYLPKVIESLGLPIISYDTQFSPNDRPQLSIQLAPTMGQMMDVMFAFLKRFRWTDFSFLCTLSYGCYDEISYIRLKIEESKLKTNFSIYGVEEFPYQLLSYVNFTNGANETEVREKLMYELHKDSRINLFHGNGSEVKSIMDIANQLGLTGKEYVWIFTSASITLGAQIVDQSYPLGSFVIGFNSSKEMMVDVVKDVVDLWLNALNNIAMSSDMDGMDFNTGFSCERIREEMSGQSLNGTFRSPLFWKYGQILYKHFLEAKLPGGLEFDEYGVLKTNRFFILNVQKEQNSTTTSTSNDNANKKTAGRVSNIRSGLSESSPRRPGHQSWSSRDSEQSAYKQTSGDNKDSGLPILEKSEPRLPDTRDRDTGSPFSRDRDTGSPFSRDRDTGSQLSRHKDTGSPFSRDKDTGSPFSRDKDTGSPFSRDKDTGSPFSRDKDTGSPFSRDKDTGSPFSRDKDTGSPFSRDKVTGSPFSRDKDTGSPFSRDKDTGSPFSRDKDTGSPFSRDKDTGSPFPRERDTGSPFPRERDTGSQLSRDKGPEKGPYSTGEYSGSNYSRNRYFNSRFAGEQISESYLNDEDRLRESRALNSKNRKASLPSQGDISESDHPQLNDAPDTPFHQNPSRGILKPGSTYVDFTELPVLANDNRSLVTSDSIFSNENAAYGISNGENGVSRSGEDLSRRSSGLLLRDRRRKRYKDSFSKGRGYHGALDNVNSDTDTLGHGDNNQLKGRFPRDVKGRQVAKKIADWDGYNLMVYDITWPEGHSIPPKGKPEKYMLKVVTWQEDPHVIYREKKISEKNDEKYCEINTVPCTVYNRNKALHRTNGTKDMCCTGLCIDLLMRLGEKLNFDVNISEVADGAYGSPFNANLTEWNGMLGMLIKKEADLAIGALSITPERSAAVDFSVPFLQTGITIIVALRHGVISATAFLEPYDYPSWSLILLFSVHATGASIFIFEWLSPYGLDQGKTSYSVHKFSLFRSFWLIWAMLFGASVSTDQPRGMASRFLANIWALFAVVFCASYTANLAAFMITKDTYYDLSGIQDWRLRNPHHLKPPFKFATIANSSTDLNIKKNYKDIHQYMKNEAQTDVKDAIKNLKAGNIQAFIYDSTTLEYEVGKDDGCKLKTVGKRIAETGYGVAFPKKSQWVKEVDKALLELQENGEIERLQKHWLARACHNKKETGVSSHTLGILNFTSAFVLLGSGIVLGVLILLLEHMYFRFGRKSLKKWDKCGCCSLVSLSMGQSLTFEQSVMEAMDYHKHHRCKDPLCETQLWKVKHDLDIALLKISQLRRQIASSASFEAAMGGGYGASSKSERDVSPSLKNGSARRRRQQASDAATDKMKEAVNQPLLALEGRNETDDDNTPVQSPKRTVSPPSQRSSFPVTKNKTNDKKSNRYSYPEQDIPKENTRRASEDRPGSRMTKEPRNVKPPERGRHKMAELDFHPPPPSFDEAMSRYRSSPTDEIMTSSPSLPTPPSPPPPAAPSPPDPSPQGGLSILSDSNLSNSSPSSDDKRYEPFILDSPESPSFSSFSETSENQLSCPGTLSKLSDEIPSTAVSQDMDSNFTSSPEMSKSLDDANTFPHVGLGAGSKFSNAQNKHLVSPIDSVRPSVLHEDPQSDSQMLVMNTSKEADNDVNTRRTRDNDGNIYVNIDDINGRETSF